MELGVLMLKETKKCEGACAKSSFCFCARLSLLAKMASKVVGLSIIYANCRTTSMIEPSR